MSLKVLEFLLNRNVLKTISILLLCSTITTTAHAQKKDSLASIQGDLSTLEKSINITKQKMKEVGDISFLPDLYFVLADLYHEKSRLLYEEERAKYPQKNEDQLDITPSKKAKKLAIEIYTRFTENYPNDPYVDKAFFNIATSYREIGLIDEMVKVFIKITKDYPKSIYWEESQLRLGDYFFNNKKNYELALEVYTKILDKTTSAYVPFAKYKMGWCHINMGQFDKALDVFESVLIVDKEDIDNSNLSLELKATDIRRDTLVAMVWPYSEAEKLTNERKNAAAYFESLSGDRNTLIQVLLKLGKRLVVKQKHDQAIGAYARVIELSYDLNTKLTAINSFYESYKKLKTPYPTDKILKFFSYTYSQLKNSNSLTKTDLVSLENNFEIYIRDLTTKLNEQAQKVKKNDLFRIAEASYLDYFVLFPKSKFYTEMATNLAEIYYALGEQSRAGYYYEQAYLRKKTQIELLQSSIKSYGEALTNADKLSRLEVEESRSGYKDMGRRYIAAKPKDPNSALIHFNIAKVYYDERNFNAAVKLFKGFISKYPSHEKAKASVHLILDTFNQREDYKGLIAFGQSMISNRSPASLDSEFKGELVEIVKQAQFRTIEDSVGDPRNRDYAKKLLAIGKKYKGSSLGDLAIYEAYTSLKQKKDPLVYQAGEELLQKHSDSKYAKEVVADLGQIAIQSGDYGRAADYFEKFISLYPRDPLSVKLTRSAAALRENQGDYEKAFEHYKNLNTDFTKLADLLAKSKKWRQLNQLATAQDNRRLIANYYVGLSLVRLGESRSALPHFDKALAISPANEEEKTFAAHALYLRASEALKDYKQIKFGRGDDAATTKLKGDKLKNLNLYYDKVIAYGNGKWVIGALYELGQSYKEFADFLLQAPIPQGLTADVVQAYKQAIATQSEEYKTKSNQYFKSCLANAEKFEVFTLFVKGCKTNGEYVVNEAIDEIQIRKPAGIVTSDITNIRKSLLDKPDQPELIKRLAEIYFKNKDYGMAKLAFNRYIELEPNDASGLSWLGVIELYSSDFEKAKFYFKSALKKDASDGLGNLALAGMYKKFAFNSLSKNISSKLPLQRKKYSQIHPWIEDML